MVFTFLKYGASIYVGRRMGSDWLKLIQPTDGRLSRPTEEGKHLTVWGYSPAVFGGKSPMKPVD